MVAPGAGLVGALFLVLIASGAKEKLAAAVVAGLFALLPVPR